MKRLATQGKQADNLLTKLRRFFVSSFDDKKALFFILLIFAVFALPIFIKPVGHIPLFRFYFEGLGEYFTPYYSPDRDKIVFGEVDSLAYYSYLPSMVIDRDFDFTNQFSVYNYRPPAFSKTGKPINGHSIGPAILWLPFFLFGHVLSLLLNLVGIKVPLHGFSLLYGLPVYFGTIFYSFLSVVLTYRFCREFFNPLNSFFAALFTLLATPLVFYTNYEAYMSHALAYFTATACIYAYLRCARDRSLRWWAAVGLFGGLTTLIRWQCASLIFFVLLVDFFSIIRKSFKESNFGALGENFLGWLVCVAVSLIAFVPQIIAWSGFLADLSEIPQVTREATRYLYPFVFQTLFSLQHGFFSWAPIAIFATVGFVFFTRRNPSPVVAVIWLFFLSQVYFIGASNWFSGQAFGQRRLIETLILVALGLGEILYMAEKKNLYRNLSIGAGFFFVWFNFVFMYQWLFGYINRYGPISFAELTYDKFWVFFHMLQRGLIPITGLFNIW